MGVGRLLIISAFPSIILYMYIKLIWHIGAEQEFSTDYLS